ncbi:hypothetical protein [Amycolatopsis samaneae]|uniref:ARB-07466-like C-terminal domain-containing protein n=1 Tax=Amycolatopsis samaneae TaxID=664691 RepID=A0ABW5GT44_9PSEU
MPGRHRKRKSPSWRLPAGLAAAVAAALPATVWLTTGDSPAVQPADAALALQAPPRPTTSASSTPPSSSPAPPTTTSATPTPASTTPPPPSTTAPKTTATPEPEACASTLAGTKPHVAQVGNHVKAKFGVKTVGGANGRSGGGEHPLGLALDFMVDTATGNRLAEYVLANQKEFGVTYVIWRQRYNDGGGWSMMEDRGGTTANHYDHVHVSFSPNAKVSVTC